MSMDVRTFQGRIGNVLNSFKWYPNVATEANQIRVALGGDATTKDTTMQTAPSGLRPGHRTNTALMHAMLHEVNKGKAGNLSTITMANIIGGLVPSPPINTVPPSITYASGSPAGTVGAIYARGSGTWAPTGTETRAWRRNGTNIPGATATTYTLVTADLSTSLTVAVTMTNAAGSTTAISAPTVIP